MLDTINIKIIQKKRKQIKKYILASITKPITTVEYRTYNEGLCTAYFFSIPKKLIDNCLEAFIAIYTKTIAFFEHWNLQELVAEDVDNIYDRWLLPQFNRYQFTMLEKEEAEIEVRRMLNSINELIDRMSREENKIGEPHNWGIYVNGQPSSHVIPSVASSSLCLLLQWNIAEIFFETKDEYVIYYWETFA